MNERESANLVGCFIDRSCLELPMNARCTRFTMQAARVTHHHVVTINFPNAGLRFDILIAFKSSQFERSISLEREFPINAVIRSLPFTDKASPELIREKTCMSKNEFKRAVGRLLKEGRITIGANSIEKK